MPLFSQFINLQNVKLLIDQKHFIINYSTTLGRPLWASYIINQQQIKKIKGGRRNFILDSTLQDQSIYQLSPRSKIFNNYWSRGHLCPSFVMSFDKSNEGPWMSTYKMSNIIPQNINFNIKNWKYLEYNIIKFASKNKFDTCVITGCTNYNLYQTTFSKYKNKLTSVIYPFAESLSHNNHKLKQIKDTSWIDPTNNWIYTIPNIMYQIIITPYDVFCFIGINDIVQTIYNIELKQLEEITQMQFL